MIQDMKKHVMKYVQSRITEYVDQFDDYGQRAGPALTFYREYFNGKFINWENAAAMVSSTGSIDIIEYHHGPAEDDRLLAVLAGNPHCQWIIPVSGFWYGNFLLESDRTDPMYGNKFIGAMIGRGGEMADRYNVRPITLYSHTYRWM